MAYTYNFNWIQSPGPVTVTLPPRQLYSTILTSASASSSTTAAAACVCVHAVTLWTTANVHRVPIKCIPLERRQ